jgi:FkbM family methyltransferase
MFSQGILMRWAVIDGRPDLPVRPGDVVIDGGGHLGESAYAALQLGARLVVTVEPDSANLIALRQNLAEEIASGRVVVIGKGLHERVGVLGFHSRGHSNDGQFVEGDEPADVTLPITTIDELVKSERLTRVDFIKLDIEGAEIPALRGAADTLRRFAPRMTVGTYHRRGDLEGVEHIVRQIRHQYQVAPSICAEVYAPAIFPQMLYFF